MHVIVCFESLSDIRSVSQLLNIYCVQLKMQKSSIAIVTGRLPNIDVSGRDHLIMSKSFSNDVGKDAQKQLREETRIAKVITHNP